MFHSILAPLAVSSMGRGGWRTKALGSVATQLLPESKKLRKQSEIVDPTLGSGPRGRWFESTRPDQFQNLSRPDFLGNLASCFFDRRFLVRLLGHSVFDRVTDTSNPPFRHSRTEKRSRFAPAGDTDRSTVSKIGLGKARRIATLTPDCARKIG